MGLQENREILRMPRPLLVGTLFFAVLLSACLFGHVARAASKVVVSPAHLQGWQSEFGASGLPAGFVADTSAPLSSRGALRLQTTDDTAASQSKARFVTALHNVSLSSVLASQAGYYTKQNNIASLSSLPSYQIDILPSGQATPITLIYEPYLGSAGTAIHAGVWQHWDVSGSTFRSTQEVDNLMTTTGQYTLAQISGMLPGATVLRVGVGIDSGSSASEAYVDAFVFNETTYDFEPDIPAIPQNVQLYGADDQIIACGSTTNSETIGLRWDAVAGDVVRYEYEMQLAGGTPSLINAGLQTTATAPIASDGQWLLRIRAVSSAGIASDWSPQCLVSIDRTAPVLTVDVGSNSSATSRVISGTTNDINSPVTIVVDGENYVVSPSLAGNWALALDGLGIGTYDIEVTSVDAVGNTSALLSTHFVVEMPVQVVTSDVELNEAIDALSRPFGLPQSINASLNSTAQQPRITHSDIEAIESQIKSNSNHEGSDIASKGVIAAQSNEGWQLFGLAWYWWVLSILGGAVGIWYFKPTRAT